MDVFAYGPESVVITAGFLILLVEIIRPDKYATIAHYVTCGALLLAAVLAGCLLAQETVPQPLWATIIKADRFSRLMALFIAGGALLAWFAAGSYLKNSVRAYSEICFLFLTSVFGLMLLVSSENFIMFIIALETANLGMYAIAASMRNDDASTEAGFKFFLISAFATALMLWGISILYGVAGSLDFDAIGSALTRFSDKEIKPFPMLGVIALIAGLGIKATLFPFHLWAPDVYEGSPTPFSAFLASAAKIASIAVLVRIVSGPIMPLFSEFKWLLSAVAAFTLISASCTALLQSNAKRLLAYSSIAHAGFLIVGLAAVSAASSNEALSALVFYIPAYILATTGAFIVLAHLEQHRRSTSITVFNGLWSTDPLLAFCMSVFLASLAGLPPTLGFMGKYLLFAQAYGYGAHLWMLFAIMAAATVILLFAYLKIIRCMYINHPEDELTLTEHSPRPLVLLMSVAVILLMFFTGPIYKLCMSAVEAL